jgi:hypothetical protein
MKKKSKHAGKRKALTQPEVAAVKQAAKRKTFAKARLELLGFNPDEIKIAETGNLNAIAKMLVERELRAVDNIVIPEELKKEHGLLVDDQKTESEKIIHTPKECGDRKGSEFIFALEDIQKNIGNGKYTTIEQCMANGYFEDQSKEDQEQLIGIANWYLNDATMLDLADEIPIVPVGLTYAQLKESMDDAAEQAYAGDASWALLMFAEIQKQYPDAMVMQGDGWYYYRRGYAKSVTGDFAGAIADFDLAISLQKNKPEPIYFYEKGWAKGHLKDYTGAKHDLTLCATTYPGFWMDWKEFWVDHKFEDQKLKAIFEEVDATVSEE